MWGRCGKVCHMEKLIRYKSLVEKRDGDDVDEEPI
jgi:hypothetical protein